MGHPFWSSTLLRTVKEIHFKGANPISPGSETSGPSWTFTTLSSKTNPNGSNWESFSLLLVPSDIPFHIPKNQNRSTFFRCFYLWPNASLRDLSQKHKSAVLCRHQDGSEQTAQCEDQRFGGSDASKKKNVPCKHQNSSPKTDGRHAYVGTVSAPSQCHSCQGLPYSSLPRKCPQPEGTTNNRPVDSWLVSLG